MSSTPSILIYAELLSNIRQVSIIASLQTPSTLDTRASLSEDRLQLRLIHSGAKVTLILPRQVAATSSLQNPKLGSQETSWRLALASVGMTSIAVDSADNQPAPWCASDISEDSEITCRKCGNTLLAVGSIQKWKDLPSENWAEMMDFWHCHKPSTPKKHIVNSHHDVHLEEKGYGANTRFMARRGAGFVDLTYFLMLKEDCTGVRLDQSRNKFSTRAPSDVPVYCESCNTTLGAADQLADGIRLYKWSICVSNPTSKSPTTYPLSYFLAAHLLAQISSQAVNKFVLHSSNSDAGLSTLVNIPATNPNTTDLTSPNPPILHIWVFAPHLTISVSNSGANPNQPILASKVFYRSISNEECAALLENADMSVEELQLPREVITELAEVLRRSTGSIPESARKFRDWDVGFLERFKA